jgi:hypothetical protein
VSLSLPQLPKRVLGEFSKGCNGSVALNFDRSGGANCDRGCPYHPQSTSAAAGGARCYADRVERRPDRRELAAKLDRHAAAGADAVLAAAERELAAAAFRVPWFRISSFGSVPASPPAGLRPLLLRLIKAGTPIHLPIETAAKANRYRRALTGVGVAVRESVATMRRWRTATGAVSIVAGTMNQSPRERVAEAKRVAAERTARTGRRAIVCPAVAARALRTGSEKAKCGICTACADPSTDIVYPAH